MNDVAAKELNGLLDRQNEAWSAGQRPSVQELLDGSSFPDDSGALLDLLYNEIVLREERGEQPALDEYLKQYPHLADDLKLHFEVHAALREDLLCDTQRIPDAGSQDQPDLEADDASPRLADYEIVGRLGEGGMAVVYKARHRRLHRLVALKMIQPGRVPSPRELLRFQTEAEAIARLQHPNIVQIYEVGQSKGLPYLVLELVEGSTLAGMLQRLTFTPKAAARLVETLARAIHHAHEQQIVHRDLKPANVLFARDATPKITDFGLAKMLEEPADSPRDATRTGEPIGTPRYMAPEQASGLSNQIGPATDVYALGTILYECLTGRAPFVAATALQTMRRIREEEPASPRRLQTAIPRDLETICLKCLYKDPRRRYASALALAEDLGRFLRHEPIHARPTPAWQRLWMWCRRRPRAAASIIATILLIFGSITGAFAYQVAERQRIAQVRGEIAGLLREGQDALSRNELQAAQGHFQNALQKARAEPALNDQELAIAGWFDHTLRLAETQHWQKRQPPPLFEELRDEALVQCLLLDPSKEKSIAAARRAIEDALALTVADDPAWRQERELLMVLDADLMLHAGNAEAALAILDKGKSGASRLWYLRRAEGLERLGGKSEAAQCRKEAEAFPPNDALATFLSGIDRLERQDLPGAARCFDDLLTLEPNHFMARLFQAACFLRQKHAAEAKVGLTACLGQRPQFAWSYLLRAEANLLMNDHAAALRDFQSGLDMRASDAARVALFTSRGYLYLQMQNQEQARVDFDRALAIVPDAPRALVGRGLAIGKGL
jgi:serine/threonine protein kinase